jgi:3-methyladenine DNA glycosylase AlkD
MAKADHLAEMQRVGINADQTIGVSLYDLRKIAKETGVNHDLALALWQTGVHEARILAGIIADPAQVDEALLENWVADFDSWDICDQVSDLFSRSRYGYAKAREWADRPEEFVKRTAFVIMAHLAVYDKAAPDEKLAQFFPIIAQHADDARNFVKKAVNWALRNIGKRNCALNRRAIAVAEDIRCQDSRPARWIAADALRELTSEKVQKRLKD